MNKTSSVFINSVRITRSTMEHTGHPRRPQHPSFAFYHIAPVFRCVTILIQASDVIRKKNHLVARNLRPRFEARGPAQNPLLWNLTMLCREEGEGRFQWVKGDLFVWARASQIFNCDVSKTLSDGDASASSPSELQITQRTYVASTDLECLDSPRHPIQPLIQCPGPRIRQLLPLSLCNVRSPSEFCL